MKNILNVFQKKREDLEIDGGSHMPEEPPAEPETLDLEPELAGVPVEPGTIDLEPETASEPEMVFEADREPEALENAPAEPEILEAETALETAEVALLAEEPVKGEGELVLPPEATLPEAELAMVAEELAQEDEEDESLEELAFLTSYSLLPTPSFSLNDVRELVQAELVTVQESVGAARVELAQVREDVPDLIQIELLRKQQDRYSASLAALQEVASEFSELRPDMLRVELTMLDEEEPGVLQKSELSVPERVEALDFIRSRRAHIKQQLAEVEAEITRRMLETDQKVTALEGRRVLDDLRQEIEGQKESVARVDGRLQQVAAGVEERARQVVGAALAALPAPKTCLGLWPTLAALAVVLAVGVAGVLLPRETEARPSVQIEMASMYQAAGDSENALRLLDEAVAAGIQDVGRLGQVGQMYYSLKEYGKAIDLLSQALERDPSNIEAGLTLARSYGRANQTRESIAQYEYLVQQEPGNWRYYSEMGAQYQAMKDYDRAFAQYQKTSELAPTRIEGPLSQANLYRALGRHDEAIAQYQKVVQINPKYYLGYVYAGLSYVGKGDHAQAIEQYKLAISAGSERFEAYFYTGEAYLAQGSFQEAIEPYRQSLEKNPQHAASYVGLGKAYVALGECANALPQFTEALKLDPKNTEAQAGLEACAGK